MVEATTSSTTDVGSIADANGGAVHGSGGGCGGVGVVVGEEGGAKVFVLYLL